MRPVLRYFGRELLGFAGVMLAVCVVVALLAPHLSLFHTYLCMMPTLCIWLPAASQPMGGSLHRNLLLGFGCRRSTCFWGLQFYMLAMEALTWLCSRFSILLARDVFWYPLRYEEGAIEIPPLSEPIFLLVGAFAVEIAFVMQFLPQNKLTAFFKIFLLLIAFMVCGLMTALVIPSLNMPLSLTPMTILRPGWAAFALALAVGAAGCGATARLMIRKAVVQQ